MSEKEWPRLSHQPGPSGDILPAPDLVIPHWVARPTMLRMVPGPTPFPQASNMLGTSERLSRCPFRNFVVRLFDFCYRDPIQLAWMVNQIEWLKTRTAIIPPSFSPFPSLPPKAAGWETERRGFWGSRVSLRISFTNQASWLGSESEVKQSS